MSTKERAPGSRRPTSTGEHWASAQLFGGGVAGPMSLTPAQMQAAWMTVSASGPAAVRDRTAL